MIHSALFMFLGACSDSSFFKNEAASNREYKQYRQDITSNNSTDARATLIELLQKHPHSEALVDNLVELEFRSGMSAKAISRAERQLQLHPGYQDLRLRLASLYTRNNQHTRALEQLAILVAGKKYTPNQLGTIDDLLPLVGKNDRIIRRPELSLLSLHIPESAVVGELLSVEVSVTTPNNCDVWVSTSPSSTWYSMRSVILDQHSNKADIRAQLQLLESGTKNLPIRIGCENFNSIEVSKQISTLRFGENIKVDCHSPLVLPILAKTFAPSAVQQDNLTSKIIRRESGRLKLQQYFHCQQLIDYNIELQRQ